LGTRTRATPKKALGGPDQNVEIAGKARRAMVGNRIASDDDEINAVGVQQGAEIGKVLLDIHSAGLR
jgi:hypothetical protein